MLILKQSHYIAISFLTVTAASTLPIGVLSLAPQTASYVVTKLCAKALKDSKLPAEVAPAIKAGLLTLACATIIAGYILLGPLLGSIFAISMSATFLINQKELDKSIEFNKFVNNKI